MRMILMPRVNVHSSAGADQAEQLNKLHALIRPQTPEEVHANPRATSLWSTPKGGRGGEADPALGDGRTSPVVRLKQRRRGP